MRIVRTNIVSNIDDGNRRQRFRRIYRCVKDLSLSFFETKIETLVVHGLHSRIFRAFSAAWRAARGGGEGEGAV